MCENKQESAPIYDFCKVEKSYIGVYDSNFLETLNLKDDNGNPGFPRHVLTADDLWIAYEYDFVPTHLISISHIGKSVVVNAYGKTSELKDLPFLEAFVAKLSKEAERSG